MLCLWFKTALNGGISCWSSSPLSPSSRSSSVWRAAAVRAAPQCVPVASASSAWRVAAAATTEAYASRRLPDWRLPNERRRLRRSCWCCWCRCCGKFFVTRQSCWQLGIRNVSRLFAYNQQQHFCSNSVSILEDELLLVRLLAGRVTSLYTNVKLFFIFHYWHGPFCWIQNVQWMLFHELAEFGIGNFRSVFTWTRCCGFCLKQERMTRGT